MKKLLAMFVFIIPVMALAEVDYFGNSDASIIPEIHTISCRADTPAGWRDDERLSLNDAKESISPRGVADGLGRIHVVWKDNRRLHGRDEIHYRVRIDTIWDTLCAVSNLDTVHNSPWIAVDKKNNLHVVFLRWFGTPYAYYDLGYRKYNDSLGSWESEERITYYDSIGLAGRPKVLCDTNDVVYAFWLNERDTPITIWYSTNNGAGWSPQMPVTDVSDSPNGYFGVAVAPDNKIHCVYQDYRTGTPELYHRYYQGGSWSSAQAVINNGFSSVYPRLAADTLNDIHLVYGGGSSLTEKIHYLVWDSNTQTWGAETKFPSQMALPHVDIAVSPLDSDVHLTFHESISSHMEIMYKHYDAQTSQWEPNVQLTFNYPDIRLDPQICLDPDDYVQLFWWDQRDGTGQEEIYYKTNRITPQVIEETDYASAHSMTLSAEPNPFRQMTEIRWQPALLRKAMPGTTDNRSPKADSRLQLKIYDVSGRLVKYFSVPTTYSLVPTVVSWDGSDCPAGVYIVNLGKVAINTSLKLIKIE